MSGIKNKIFVNGVIWNNAIVGVRGVNVEGVKPIIFNSINLENMKSDKDWFERLEGALLQTFKQKEKELLFGFPKNVSPPNNWMCDMSARKTLPPKITNMGMRYKRIINRTMPIIEYPIGRNIGYAIELGEKYAEILMELYPKSSFVLICTGSSGAMLSALTAQNLQGRCKEIIHVKKPGEDSHDRSLDIRKYKYPPDIKLIILDDHIDTGTTLQRIYSDFYIQNQSSIIINALLITGSVPLNRFPDYMFIEDIISQHTVLPCISEAGTFIW